jgi:peptidoglycan/LPS O-acetylase OafA/YrhL
MISLKHRSDIDGLRAVAVLGVVIYHAFPWVLPGGFIGVDIFFVISGYLISGILYKGHNAENFSFGEFYARRIRRLFPALITVLLLCLAYGWMILLPDEFRQLGKHVAAGTLFIQNFVFWNESGYFDTAANLKPLLHLWSLAVEEQFYIFFPPLLILLWKKPKILVPAMVVLLVASFLGNIIMSVQNSTTDFFLTPYRAWEFLGGSLLAWWHYEKNHEEDVPLHRNLLSWGGLLLLALGMAVIHTGDAYPGWRALLPVAGTLLLMEGGRDAWVNRKLLSHPAIVWVGLISYPLYLFHWPALSFVHIIKGETPEPRYILMALLVSIVLTVLTYYFIEKKIRHNTSRWTASALVGGFLLIGILGGMAWGRMLPQRSLSEIGRRIVTAKGENLPISGLQLMGAFHGVPVYGVGGNGPKTLFIGDSNAQMYEARIAKQLEGCGEAARGAIFVAQGGIPPLPGVLGNHGQRLNVIPSFREVLQRFPEIDRVVIAARWGMYFKKDQDYFFEGKRLSEVTARDATVDEFGKMIRELVASGKKVWVVLNIPTSPLLAPENSHPRSFSGEFQKENLVYKKADFLGEYGSLRGDLKRVSVKNGAFVIDPLGFLCEGENCIGEYQGGPLYQDQAHLLRSYIRSHVTYLDETVEP